MAVLLWTGGFSFDSTASATASVLNQGLNGLRSFHEIRAIKEALSGFVGLFWTRMVQNPQLEFYKESLLVAPWPKFRTESNKFHPGLTVLTLEWVSSVGNKRLLQCFGFMR